MNNITKIWKSELVNLSIRQGRKLGKHHTKIGRAQYSKMEANPELQIFSEFPCSQSKKKKEKLFMKRMPYERHKQANNKIPKNSVQSFAEPHTSSRELNLGPWKVKRKSGTGGRSMDIKLRNYWIKQSPTDFSVAGLCRNFNVLITNLQRAVQCALLI